MQETPECVEEGGEKEADELRCVWRLSVFNFPHISLGLIDGREQSVNIFIVVISKKRRLLVARLRKYRPPSPQYSSLSKSRAFPLRLGPLPAFGPAMIEEGTEAKACMCNHEHIRWELKAHFFKRVCVSPARSLLWISSPHCRVRIHLKREEHSMTCAELLTQRFMHCKE